MSRWQWARVWVWLVGLGAIEAGGEWCWEPWEAGKLGGGGQCPLRGWGAKLGPFSLFSTFPSHPPPLAWAFLWRVQLSFEKFLEQNGAPPQPLEGRVAWQPLGLPLPLGVGGGLLGSCHRRCCGPQHPGRRAPRPGPREQRLRAS